MNLWGRLDMHVLHLSYSCVDSQRAQTALTVSHNVLTILQFYEINAYWCILTFETYTMQTLPTCWALCHLCDS